MKLSTSLVAVKKISSAVPREKFSEDELKRVAELILKAEGIINPPIIRRKSFELFEVVDGDFEYYAAAKAREIDPRKGEMIGAFIIESENEELLTEQVKFLRKRESDDLDIKELNIKLKEFDSLPEKVENLKVMLTEVAEYIKKIENIVSKQPEPTPVVQKEKYNNMTVKELKAIASERNMKILSKAKKDDIVAALIKADASQSYIMSS